MTSWILWTLCLLCHFWKFIAAISVKICGIILGVLNCGVLKVALVKMKVRTSIHVSVSPSEIMKPKLLPLLLSDCIGLVNTPDLLIINV